MILIRNFAVSNLKVTVMKGKRLEKIDQCCLASNVFGLIADFAGKANLNKLPGYTKVCCNNIMIEITHLISICNQYDDDLNNNSFIKYMNEKYKDVFRGAWTLGNIDRTSLDKLLPRIDSEVIHNVDNSDELPF